MFAASPSYAPACLPSNTPHCSSNAVTAAVTGHSQPTPKAFNFKLSPGNADVLHQLHLGFVATANNHVLDYGQPGLKETNEVSCKLSPHWAQAVPVAAFASRRGLVLLQRLND